MVESFSLPKKLVSDIEALVKESGHYSSKSEFYRDAVRKHYLERKSFLEAREQLRKVTKKFNDKVRHKWKPLPNNSPIIPREERAEIAAQYLREKGLNPKDFGYRGKD